MYKEENIQSAIKAGILSEETAAALRSHVTESEPSLVDEEQFRLVTGFNDIFVVIACLLLLTSINWVVGNSYPWLGCFASAATAWGLTEFFVRKRRMALPAIVLLLAFVSYIFSGSLIVVAKFITDVPTYKAFNSPINYILPAFLATFAAYMHWKRFKVPITVAAGTATLVIGFLALILFNATTRPLFPIACLAAGIAVFMLAMRWDSLDTSRQTRKADVAFWLHLLASPLIIHSIFSMLGVLSGKVYLFQAIIVFMLYISIGLISLLIDRRAMLVSALGYVIYVFSSIINDVGSVSTGFGITSFFIGSALLLLSAYWHPCRRLVLNLAPVNLRKYLPQ